MGRKIVIPKSVTMPAGEIEIPYQEYGEYTLFFANGVYIPVNSIGNCSTGIPGEKKVLELTLSGRSGKHVIYEDNSISGYSVTDATDEDIVNTMSPAKYNELANARYQEEVGGYVYNGYTFHSDRQSQDRIFQAYMASLNDPNFSQTWKTKTGWIGMTAQDFVTLYNEFHTFLQGLYQKEYNLQEQIDLATTPEELDQISW
jgi:hypothetical protein